MFDISFCCIISRHRTHCAWCFLMKYVFFFMTFKIRYLAYVFVKGANICQGYYWNSGMACAVQIELENCHISLEKLHSVMFGSFLNTLFKI